MSTLLPDKSASNVSTLNKKINDERDVVHFKSKSPSYRNIVAYIDLLCERIHGTSNKVINQKYTLRNAVFQQCSEFIDNLGKLCDETDLNLEKTASSLRFGHLAFRDWYDGMKNLCQQFINNLVQFKDEQFKEELLTYLSESFGNRMRIDYGTGHELNFILFTMGLANLADYQGGDSNGDSLSKSENKSLIITPERLKKFVETHGWDVHALFAHKYLRLCRKVQTKFRLEPAGSRGVYNMDDFQFLPFLFGTAQLAGIKYIPSSEFYEFEQVNIYKNDYIFFDAVDFILNNKRGPFNEHSYTLWCYTNLGSWDNIFRRIRVKFTDDILGPFPIVQHLLFGVYILRWES